MTPDLAISLLATVGTAILGAGVLLNRVKQTEKDVDKLEDTGERVTKMEADTEAEAWFAMSGTDAKPAEGTDAMSPDGVTWTICTPESEETP